MLSLKSADDCVGFESFHLLSAKLLKLMQHNLGLAGLNPETPRCQGVSVDNDLITSIRGKESDSKTDEDCFQSGR